MDDVARIAMSLPDATEVPHHGMRSFRVGGKIFATVPDDEHVRIMAGEPEILAAAAENPGTCEPYYWGKRLACVVVDVRRASPELVRELLVEAYLRKAPKSLADQVN
jgi:hypothetical protein